MSRLGPVSIAFAAALVSTGVRAEYKNVAELSAAVMPAFVDIYTRGLAKAEADNGMPPGKTTQIQDEVGSGFIVDSSGLIVTNRHVVESAYSIFVTLASGEHVPA